MVITMAKLRMAHASTHGARKPPGPKEEEEEEERLNDGDKNGQATHGARKHSWRTQAAWANKAYPTLKLSLVWCGNEYLCSPNTCQLNHN